MFLYQTQSYKEQEMEFNFSQDSMLRFINYSEQMKLIQDGGYIQGCFF